MLFKIIIQNTNKHILGTDYISLIYLHSYNKLPENKFIEWLH